MRFRRSVRWTAFIAAFAAVVLGVVAGPVRGEEETAPAPPPDVGVLRLTTEHVVGDLVVRPYELPSLGHLSYLLGAKGKAVVVDPVADVDVYLEDAAARDLTIEAVLLTSVPYDVRSGHGELVERCGARVLVSAAADVSFAHEAVSDGDTFDLGGIRLEFWATPGTTPDALSILVHAPATGVDPAYVLTGDALLLGGMGRTDRLAGAVSPQALAEQAFDSVQRLELLDENTRLLPGHVKGSRIAVRAAEGTMSTMGAERQRNVFLTPKSRAVFTARALDALPALPPYFTRVHTLNREGAPISTPAVPAALDADATKASLAGGALVVDVRPPDVYAAGHVHGSLNLPLEGRLETWFGSVVPHDREVLIVGTEAQGRSATARLGRIAFAGFAGRIPPDRAAWEKAGLSVATSRLWTPQEFAQRRRAWIEPLLVDVRSAQEVARRRIPDGVHVSISQWKRLPLLFEKDQPIVFLCKTAYRSSLAVGFAEQMGFEMVGSLAGGLVAWMEAGLPVVPPVVVTQEALPSR